MPVRIADKMGIKEAMRILLIHTPQESVEAIDPPQVTMHTEAQGLYDHILLFVTTEADLDRQFPALKPHLDSQGKLWVAWPKGGLLGTDLTIKNVIRVGYDHGLVESTNLRIDDTWTALKFTHPKPGKQYHNSYGTLPYQQA